MTKLFKETETLWTPTPNHPDFPGSHRTHYTPDFRHEWLMLMAVCDTLNEIYCDKGDHYRIGETWEDYGAGLWWQTIIVDNMPKGQRGIGEYQLLCPRDHRLLTCGDPASFASGMKNVIDQLEEHYGSGRTIG